MKEEDCKVKDSKEEEGDSEEEDGDSEEEDGDSQEDQGDGKQGGGTGVFTKVLFRQTFCTFLSLSRRATTSSCYATSCASGLNSRIMTA